MKIRKPDAVIFDWDGTISNSFRGVYEIDSGIVAEEGGKMPSIGDYRIMLGNIKWNDLYTHLGVKDAKRAVEMFYERFHSRTFFPVPGAEMTLQRLLAHNIPLALVSFDRNLEGVMGKVGKTGLDFYFGNGNIHVAVGRKTEPILRVCEELDVSPRKVVFVGDTAKDVRDSRAAGNCAVAIANDYSYNDPETIKKTGPDYILEDIANFPNLLIAE